MTGVGGVEELAYRVWYRLGGISVGLEGGIAGRVEVLARPQGHPIPSCSAVVLGSPGELVPGRGGPRGRGQGWT